LLDAARHRNSIIVPYGGYAENDSIQVGPTAGGPDASRISADGLKTDPNQDLPAQRSWNGLIDKEGRSLDEYLAIEVEGRSTLTGGAQAVVLLIERDGMAWGSRVELPQEFGKSRIALANLEPTKAAMLPRDFPIGINPYFLRWPAGRGGPGDQLNLNNLQAVQVAVRRTDGLMGIPPLAFAEFRRVSLVV